MLFASRCGLLATVFMVDELRTASAFYSHHVTSHRRLMSTMAEPELPRQWVVMREDLRSEWPAGSMIAQACHASVAAIVANKDDPLTQQYLGSLEKMHKVPRSPVGLNFFRWSSK